jgi:poly(3-hydroxybutyrate) depolymerase
MRLPPALTCFFSPLDHVDITYLNELIKKATTDFNADPQRVYIVGFSLGGIFTAEVSVSLRDSVAAVCNWCGGIPTPRKWMDESLKTMTLGMRPDLCGHGRKMPVYLLTAEKDINRIEVDGAKLEYQKANWPIRYECQPGSDATLYFWLRSFLTRCNIFRRPRTYRVCG